MGSSWEMDVRWDLIAPDIGDLSRFAQNRPKTIEYGHAPIDRSNHHLYVLHTACTLGCGELHASGARRLFHPMYASRMVILVETLRRRSFIQKSFSVRHRVVLGLGQHGFQTADVLGAYRHNAVPSGGIAALSIGCAENEMETHLDARCDRRPSTVIPFFGKAPALSLTCRGLAVPVHLENIQCRQAKPFPFLALMAVFVTPISHSMSGVDVCCSFGMGSSSGTNRSENASGADVAAAAAGTGTV